MNKYIYILIGVIAVAITVLALATNNYSEPQVNTNAGLLNATINSAQETEPESTNVNTNTNANPATPMTSYRNTDFGIVFQYPKTWNKYGDDVFDRNLAKISFGNQEFQRLNVDGAITVTARVAIIPQKVDFGRGGPGGTIINTESMSISGYGVTKTVIDLKKGEPGGFGGTNEQNHRRFRFVLETDNRYYDVECGATGENYLADYDLCEKALATFEFIPENLTVGWNTYTNNSHGFSMEHPLAYNVVEQETGVLFQKGNTNISVAVESLSMEESIKTNIEKEISRSDITTTAGSDTIIGKKILSEQTSGHAPGSRWLYYFYEYNGQTYRMLASSADANAPLMFDSLVIN